MPAWPLSSRPIGRRDAAWKPLCAISSPIWTAERVLIRSVPIRPSPCRSLNESLQPYATILARVLGDALLEVPAVQAGALSKEQAAELFLRMAYSHFLLPHPDPEVFLANLCDFAQISRRAVRRIAG